MVVTIQKQILALIKDIQDEYGMTVLLITHRPAPLAIADRTVRLEGGRIVG